MMMMQFRRITDISLTSFCSVIVYSVAKRAADFWAKLRGSRWLGLEVCTTINVPRSSLFCVALRYKMILMHIILTLTLWNYIIIILTFWHWTTHVYPESWSIVDSSLQCHLKLYETAWIKFSLPQNLTNLRQVVGSTARLTHVQTVHLTAECDVSVIGYCSSSLGKLFLIFPRRSLIILLLTLPLFICLT